MREGDLFERGIYLRGGLNREITVVLVSFLLPSAWNTPAQNSQSQLPFHPFIREPRYTASSCRYTPQKLRHFLANPGNMYTI